MFQDEMMSQSTQNGVSFNALQFGVQQNAGIDMSSEMIDKLDSPTKMGGVMDVEGQFEFEYRSYLELPPLPPSIDKEMVVADIKRNLESNDWMKQINGIDQLRCINKQFPGDMMEACMIFNNQILECTKSMRSAVCKNSLLFLSELFASSHTYKHFDGFIESIIPELFIKCFNDKIFIREVAEKAMDEIIKNCVYDVSFIAFCKGCFDKNGRICELSIQALHKLTLNAGDGLSQLQEPTFRDYFITLAKV